VALLTLGIFVGCLWPLIYSSMVIHELGHAAVALQRTSGPVTIRIGNLRTGHQLQVGRLRVLVSRHGLAGLCHFPKGQLSRSEHLVQVLAGPLANLIAGWVLVMAAIDMSSLWPVRAVLLLAAAVNLITGLGGLRPNHSRGEFTAGLPSDGLQAWYLLRGRPVPEWHRPATNPHTNARQSTVLTSEPGLPPHWTPADPAERRKFEAELRRALLPAQPGEDPIERHRLDAQLRVALIPAEETHKRLARMEREAESRHVASKIAPAAHDDPRPAPGT
jgi:hypothetical protein